MLHLCMWGKLFSGACVSDSPSPRIAKGGEREFRETCCDTLTFTYSVANRRVAGIHPRVLLRCQRQVSSNRRRSSQQNHLADKIISVLDWHIPSYLRTFYWVSKFTSCNNEWIHYNFMYKLAKWHKYILRRLRRINVKAWSITSLIKDIGMQNQIYHTYILRISKNNRGIICNC